jgi:hypothetical protein
MQILYDTLYMKRLSFSNKAELSSQMIISSLHIFTVGYNKTVNYVTESIYRHFRNIVFKKFTFYHRLQYTDNIQTYERKSVYDGLVVVSPK